MGKISFFIIAIFILSCKSQEQQSSLLLINEKIGDNAVIDYNPDRSFALVQEKYVLMQDEQYTTNYLIIRMADNAVMQEGKVVHGHIKWINDNVIEIFEMPGVLKDGESEDDYKKHINIESMRLKKNQKSTSKSDG